MIYVSTDHAGFELSKSLVAYLLEKGEEVTDLGPEKFDKQDDYPDFASGLAEYVQKENARGVLICGSAQGMCMTANKFRGVRAGIGYSAESARMMREHNDTNVLCLSGGSLSADDAKTILDTWLSTDFSGEERHVRRLAKISEIEKKNFR